MATKKFYAPTPVKWRKLGDALLILGVSLQPLTLTLPLTDDGRLWVNFGIGAVGVIGKFLTNLATEE